MLIFKKDINRETQTVVINGQKWSMAILKGNLGRYLDSTKAILQMLLEKPYISKN